MKSPKTYELSDGIVIEVSDLKSNRTGYTGAALSPAWTQDADRPFIAACGNPRDPEIMKQMHAQNRTAWHGGSYSDAREAAYVVGMFKKDPVGTERLIHASGPVDKFPADLYDLPEGLSHEKAIEILKVSRDNKVKKSSTVSVVKNTDSPAAGNLYDFFSRDDVVAVAKTLGGGAALQESIKGITIAEFADRYQIPFKKAA